MIDVRCEFVIDNIVQLTIDSCLSFTSKHNANPIRLVQNVKFKNKKIGTLF